MRDHFEHFDERLAAWGEEAHGAYIDRNLGPPSSFRADAPVLRNYDPATDTITFRDASYGLEPIRAELGRLVERSSAESGIDW
jgi:hypothetical protein